MRRLPRRTAIVATTLVVTLGGGAAFAYWLNSATVTAEAQTANGARLSISNLSTSSPAMTPGDQQYWTFQVNNQGDANQTIDVANSSITITPFSSQTVDPTKDACTQADYEIDPAAIGWPSYVSAHNNTGGSFYLKFLNKSTDQVNCQGIKVPITVTIKAA